MVIKKGMPSSVVHKMDYNETTGNLRITYVSGSVYEYKGVPLDVFNAMKRSGSKGAFLNTQIKGRYDYEKVA